MDEYTAALQETLQQTLAPETVKKASARLSKELYTNEAALPALVHILQTGNDQVRQLAAVEARKLVVTKWETLAAPAQAECREAVLQSTFTQPTSLVRHSLARVVAAIAEYDLTENKWPQLLPLLLEAVHGEQKPMAVYCLYALLETLIPALAVHQRDFVQLFSGLLADPLLEIRVNAVRCLDCLSLYIEEDEEIDAAAAAQFKASIPGMMAVLKDVLAADDSDAIKSLFDVLSALVYLDNKLVGDQIVPVIHYVSELAAATSVDEEYRCMALQFLILVVSMRKTKVLSNNLGPALTNLAAQVSAEEVDVDDELNNEEEENENEENTPAALGLRLLSSLATELPPSQVLVPLLENMPAMVSSANTFSRRGGLLCLSVAVAGAPDFCGQYVLKFVPLLVQVMQDPEPVVKTAAARTVSALASTLQEQLSDHHEQLLPQVLAIIDSALHVMTYKHACHALDGLIEFMGHKDIAKFIAPLMEKLFAMLASTNSPSMKSAIVSAIGSAAFAAGKGFIPYFDQSIVILEPFLSNAADTSGMSEPEIELRAITFENISTMARAVGTEPFSKYATPLVEAAYSSVGSDNARIRESGFAFISNMAKVYGAEFAGFLDQIVPQIIKCLEQEEFLFGGDEDDEEFVDDDDDEDISNKFKFNSGITIEKEMACLALYELALGTGAAFAKWVEPSFKALSEQVETSYAMRDSAMNGLWKIVQAMFKASYGSDFVAPKGVPEKPYLDSSITALIEQVRAITISTLEEEYEFGLVTCSLDNITEAVQNFGIAALVSSAADTTSLEKLCVQLMLILKKEHMCQVDDEEGVADESEDSSESDLMLHDAAIEVLIVLARQLGADFLKIFDSFKDTIIANVTSKSKTKRVSTLGGLAEICVGLRDSNPYTQELMLIFLDRLANDKSLEVKGNSAYGVGIIIENSGVDFSASFQPILQMMFHLMSESDKQASLPDGEVKDVVDRCISNACGCVARMGLKNSDQIPLDQVVPALLNHLPLRSGFEEYVPILLWIIKLYESGNPAIDSQSEKVIDIFAKIFEEEADRIQLEQESTLGRDEAIDRRKQFQSKDLEQKVVDLMKFLNQKYSAQISKYEILKSVIAQ